MEDHPCRPIQVVLAAVRELARVMGSDQAQGLAQATGLVREQESVPEQESEAAPEPKRGFLIVQRAYPVLNRVVRGRDCPIKVRESRIEWRIVPSQRKTVDPI